MKKRRFESVKIEFLPFVCADVITSSNYSTKAAFSDLWGEDSDYSTASRD